MKDVFCLVRDFPLSTFWVGGTFVPWTFLPGAFVPWTFVPGAFVTGNSFPAKGWGTFIPGALVPSIFVGVLDFNGYLEPSGIILDLVDLQDLSNLQDLFRLPRSLQLTGGPPKFSEPLNHPRFSGQLKPQEPSRPSRPTELSRLLNLVSNFPCFFNCNKPWTSL